ncbi:MAG: hypothetical protein OXE92_05335 [Bacteroidetes bacterium]|nr:hypothetical protein [Bacteroidota bacterium]MCY4205132.1 hypothetical protein [Bacteroidota bacterium]
MTRVALFLLLLLYVPIHVCMAQLRVDRPLLLGENGTPALIEMITEREYGAWYDAAIQGGFLRMGGHTLPWTPHLSCNHSHDKPTTSMCRVRAERTLFWHVYGEVVTQSLPSPGMYQGSVTLIVRGPTGTHSISVPVTYEVLASKTSCAVSSSGALEFGGAKANRAGIITVDPETGLRKYQENHGQSPGTFAHQVATLTLTTSSQSALVTVTSPHILQSPYGHVGFTSQLAYKAASGSRYLPLITGSGSRRIHTGGEQIVFRLGGVVTTYATSPESDYEGLISLTFLCDPLH